MSVHDPSAVKRQAGFTLIDLLLTISLICTLASIALPSLSRAKGSAQSASAIATLRVVNSAQLSFAVSCGSGFYSPALPSLGVAPPGSPTAFLPADLTSGATLVKSGYAFNVTGTPLAGAPASCNGLAAGAASPGYTAIADPLDAVANPRFYGTNAGGTIYVAGGTFAGTIPESGPSPMGTPIQ